LRCIFANGIAEITNRGRINMSQITVNDRVYNIQKTYEAALGIVICFVERIDLGLQYTMMLTPEGDWRFTGSHAAELEPIEHELSTEIRKLTEYPICYS